MAKIGLIDVDGHNFPNLALMKISGYHKSQGDMVEWVNHLDTYDTVYKSKVFTFTPDNTFHVKANNIVKGGTGYSMTEELFCDTVQPDYNLYPKYPHAYGFLTRGCIRRCSWCIVPKKEGNIKPYDDIENILQNRSSAILMDNNVLAHEYGLQQIEKIIKIGCKVDFNQGLDARLVTDDIAIILSKVKWIKSIRFACDTMAGIEPLCKAVEKLNRNGIKSYRISVYVLVKDVDDAHSRTEIIRKLGAKPFAQPYRDFTAKCQPTYEQRLFTEYVNRKKNFYSSDWSSFKKWKKYDSSNCY